MEQKNTDHNEGNWDDAPIEDDEHVRKESAVSEKKEIEEEQKPEEKIVYQKDKYGNILITSLGDYVEPPKQIKGFNQGDIANSQFNAFANADVDISDSEDQGGVILEETLASNTTDKKDKKKKQLKGKHAVADDGLDDLLKELGVEEVKKEVKQPEKKEKKQPQPQAEKKVEKPKEEQSDPEKKKEEGEEKKKKPTEKKPAAKSHLNDQRREIKQRQEALKKKDKKKA